LGSYVLSEAGLSPAEIEKLQAMPWKDYITVATKAQQKLAQELGPGGGLRRGFNPVVDGVVLPQDPYSPQAAPTPAASPMLICSSTDELSPSWLDSSLENVTLADVVEKVKVRAGFGPGFGDKARDVVDAYARAFPGERPIKIWSLIAANRQASVALA